MELLTQSSSQTQKAGQRFSADLTPLPDKATILALSGDMGSGKTTFAQGIGQGLGIKKRIISPTFIIMRKYTTDSNRTKFKFFYHIDLYRLEGNISKELQNLGLTDEMQN